MRIEQGVRRALNSCHMQPEVSEQMPVALEFVCGIGPSTLIAFTKVVIM